MKYCSFDLCVAMVCVCNCHKDSTCYHTSNDCISQILVSLINKFLLTFIWAVRALVSLVQAYMLYLILKWHKMIFVDKPERVKKFGIALFIEETKQ